MGLCGAADAERMRDGSRALYCGRVSERLAVSRMAQRFVGYEMDFHLSSNVA
jgi:hypothetical protein